MNDLTAHLAKLVMNRPLAILPDQLGQAVAILRESAPALFTGPAERKTLADAGAIRAFDFGDSADKDYLRGYDICQGVAVIRVCGMLVNRLGCLWSWWGMTGYDGIRQAFLGAMDDPNVKAIVLDIDSGGGEVSGCFDLVDVIFAARGRKQVWAILDDCAYSAAYAIASACSRIVVPRTGGVGSVGVVCMHVDFSQALEKAGIDVTLIQYGARKTDFVEVKPLASAAAKRLQADIDTVGELFVATVARNRGMAVNAVRDTEAATFQGLLGVEAGLADAVMAPDVAFQDLLSRL